MKTKRVLFTIFALLLASSLLFVACKPKPTEEVEEPVAEEAEEVEEVEEEAEAITEVETPEIDCMGAAEGDEVALLYQWSGLEEENLNNILAPVVDACGIVLNPESTRDQALLDTRVQAGTPPDIAFWNVTQLEQYQDTLVPLDTLGVNAENYADYWQNIGTVNDQWLGLPVKADIKTIIWYSPVNFEAFGYEVPTNWDELDALVEQMVADGNVPWSMGMESGDATGWTGSDFIQDIMLVKQGPDYVNGLLDGSIPYDDAGVVEAYEIYGKWAKDPVYTVGGAQGTVSTAFLDAIYKPFSDPPEAMMVKQSGFAGGAVAEQYPDLEYGSDYDFFGVPGAQGVQGGSDWMMMFSDEPAVKAIIAYLSSDMGGQKWAEVGFDLTPNSAGAEAYTDSALLKKAAVLANATGFTPDIGDTIPSGFGSAEWKAIVDFVNGTDLAEVLAEAAAVQAEAFTGKPAEEAEAEIDCMGAAEGDEVALLYQWSGLEEENLNNILAPVVDACGIVLNPESTRDQALLDTRVQAGTPPDIAFWNVTQLEQYQDTLVSLDTLGVNAENYADYWQNIGTVNDQWLGLPVKADIKTIIWYSPVNFEAFGYEVPTNWDELDALVEQMVADGNVPWSMGMESGDATGWTGSDFIQDIMLVKQGPDYVNGLLDGSIPYDDAGVVEAYEIYGKWAKDPVYTVGGAQGTVSTAFLDAIYKPFSDPPEAMMVKQSGFAGGAVAEQYPDLEYGSDYDFFGVPGAQGVQGGSDWMMMFSDEPAVKAIIAYLSSDMGGQKWAEVGFDLTPNSAGAEAYTDSALLKKAAVLANATGFTPDIGDTIPSGFGSAEWKAIVDFVNGTDLAEALAEAAAVQAEAFGQ
ncbi:MAG: ABC transporter substrate-binding protein [Chloroflexota bacterium]|nr:ABC transporter substrate-binding protein [Chloroflexota bacterium]